MRHGVEPHSETQGDPPICVSLPSKMSGDMWMTPSYGGGARHVVTENFRVKMAASSWSKGRVLEFGSLMAESHKSLRDDYEVTGPELDALVEAALEANGCIGARMTGAGFGGCALALVRSDLLEGFKEQVTGSYRERTGIRSVFYALA